MKEQVMNEQFVKNQLNKERLREKHAEPRLRMKKYDDVLARMINAKTRETILTTIKDFLSQHES
jgi:hypothetical protein